MIGKFKANNPYNNILLFVYGFFLKLPLFIWPAPALQTPYDGILYKAFLNISEPVVQSFPYWYACLSFLLFYVQAVQLNRAAANLKLFQKTNYLTGMSYLLVTSLFVDWYAFSSLLIVNSILIWVWAQLCGSHTFKNAKTSIFNIGFVISLAAFFYLPAALFIIMMLLSITITRPFKLPEWIIGLMGLLTPVYFYLVWMYLSNNWLLVKVVPIQISLPHFFNNLLNNISFGYTWFISLIGWYFVQANLRRQVVQTRKNWQLLYLYIFIAVLLTFINVHQSFITVLFLAVPLSLLTAAAFLYPEKKWFPLAAHWGMVLLSLLIFYWIK